MQPVNEAIIDLIRHIDTQEAISLFDVGVPL
ncbi:hypothetical protein QO002_001791 [Pararhizobium capsulatum DSM 1112]|uniref:Uncharacterized protein n=1 Tax=Pararhizobium capsulatum DSM 1112 TaxID=1121113 RepID=A0ABU0BN24_9HYPH|nr:hypothetical protein [Pararhizobium capsulatum DSM 1112]